jgi:limonene 1,2-monooxygenase
MGKPDYRRFHLWPKKEFFLTDNALRFGVFVAPFHALEEDPTALFTRDLELMIEADELGFDEGWYGEHHSGGFETIAAPELMIAAAAERTRHIKLGAGVKSLPYHNPFIVADTMVQLDHMTRGRTLFGVGPGALPSDAYQFGIEPKDTRRMMEESLDVIMRLLDGERVTARTDWFDLREARLQLGNYTKPHMEMAVTSIRSPAGAMAAGKHGLGMLSLGGVTDDALEAYARNWKICEEAARETGRAVSRDNFRIAIVMHLSETREQAVADVSHGFHKWVGYSQEVLAFGPVPRGTENPLDFVINTRRAVIGTPQDAIQAIEDAQAGSGGFGVVLLMVQDWADAKASAHSRELFARDVMPHFRDHSAGRRDSYKFASDHHEQFLDAAKKGVTDAEERYTAHMEAAKK